MHVYNMRGVPSMHVYNVRGVPSMHACMHLSSSLIETIKPYASCGSGYYGFELTAG